MGQESAARSGLNPESNMARLLRPSSVAVIGVGSKADAPASRLVRNLQAFGFSGTIYPINKKYDRILDLPCYPALAAAPGPVDLVVIAVPAADVPDLVRSGALLGIKSYIILSSGFGEIGEAGKALEVELSDLARQYGLLVMGPNCVGSINFHAGVNLSFTAMFDGEQFLPGPVAFIGQSGGLATIFYSLAVRQGIGFSHLVSSGNETVLSLADYLDFMIDDPGTKVILAYAEQLRDGNRLIELGHRAKAAGKHIIILKSARASAGARAAISHTGSLAGNDAVCSALFRRAGIIKVRTMEEMLATCKVCLSDRPLPKGRNVALLAISGGSAVMAADLAEENGFTVPSLSPESKERLREWLPEFASFDNPIDVTAGLFFQPEKFAKVLECLVSDPVIDLIVILGAYRHDIAQRLAAGSADVLAACSKYSAAAWIASGPEVEQSFVRKGVPFFENLAQCFEGLDKVVAQRSADAAVRATDPEAPQDNAAGKVLTEDVVKAMLRDGGIPVPAEAIATSAEEALQAAAGMGFPLAIKVLSPDIPHRAKVGGIALGIHSADALADEYRLMMGRVVERVPAARIDGVLVQKMIPPGPELFLGMSHDLSFGKVMTFGMGGILTEAIGQVTFGMLPVSLADAREMVADVPAARTLLSFQPGAADAVAQLIVSVSDWCMAQGDRLRELDLNPIMLDGGRPVLVDGLAVMGID